MCFDMHQSEKLAIFVDDMRRNGVALEGPDMNHSEAEFSVEQTDESYAVRYALAGIRNVGEKAMEAIVAEREANGAFKDLDDLFRRAPPGSMNRRQLEGLAAAGAFDSLEPNRAKVLANADTLLAEADRSAKERSSTQHSLLDQHEEQALRLSEVEPWTRPEQMAKERENFGFYFAAHPVAQWKEIASANGARPYASLMASGAPGGRAQAVIAAMVENVSRGKTKRGKDFARCDFSDSSGQFSAACFEEGLVEPLLGWAKNGTCVLLTVELDSPSPEEPPRVTVRGARPLAEVTSSTRLEMTLDIERVEAVAELKMALVANPDRRGDVVVRVLTGDLGEKRLLLGQNFVLDGDLVEAVASIAGISNVSIHPGKNRSHLRLVA
jgi:DNA polymerase-3 subunit alpha